MALDSGSFNSSNNVLYLDIPSALVGYKIIAQTGQLLMAGKEKSINIEGLTAGMYQIQIETSTGVKTLRFIKANN
jgi:hypothetical protein